MSKEKVLEKIQNSLNFWWILSITLFLFSLIFLIVIITVYNNYYYENNKTVIDDNKIITNINA